MEPNPATSPLDLDRALTRFGLRAFRHGQRDVIEAVLAGRATIAVLPTGAGKSLCYQLPAVALGGLTVVVSPLISLMKDQVDSLVERGIPATYINSAVDPGERDARLQRAIRGEVRLLYVAPERFRVPHFVGELGRAALTLLAIDEAHCISEWGHDFRPDYARLGEVVQRLTPRRLVALTATATPDVREEIRAQLGLRDPAVFVRGFDRPNLQFTVEPVGGDADKLPRCVALLREEAARPALIYTATRKKAESVAEKLRGHRFKARAYHAGLDDEERGAVQDAWMGGALDVVVATNAFGMGVDKSDVRLVIHHDLPGSAEAYWQEAGRAGRDGDPARCVLFFNHADVRLREFLIQSAGDNGPKSPARQESELRRLRAMMAYAYAPGCRRAFLLGYFGDPAAGESCAGCDNCASRRSAQPLADDEQLLVRKVLATVARLDGRFGRNRIALVLEGSTSREVLDANLERLGTYGVLRGRSHTFVLDLLGSLEAAGLIASTRDEYPTLRITREGREVMHDRERARLTLPAERTNRRKKRASSASRATRAESIGDVDEQVFERLRGARAQLAAEARLPAYCIAHDRTLAELARRQPRTMLELADVPGFGAAKLAKYGERLLRALHDGGEAEAR
jgi:ATP-dependent DNA helicase RecQ